MINYSPYLSFLKINHFSVFKYFNNFLFLLTALVLLFVSCSATRRFPDDESTETINKTSKIIFSSVRVLLDESDAATTSTLDLQIVGLVDRADNLLSGTGSSNKVAIVKFNDPQDKPLRTGIS